MNKRPKGRKKRTIQKNDCVDNSSTYNSFNMKLVKKNSLPFFGRRRGQLLWIGRLWTGPRNLLPLPEWILFKFSTKGRKSELIAHRENCTHYYYYFSCTTNELEKDYLNIDGWLLSQRNIYQENRHFCPLNFFFASESRFTRLTHSFFCNLKRSHFYYFDGEDGSTKRPDEFTLQRNNKKSAH